MDVAGWLRSLGLDQYETAFPENSITAELLPKLTPEDLRTSASRLSAIAVNYWRPLVHCIVTKCQRVAQTQLHKHRQRRWHQSRNAGRSV